MNTHRNCTFPSQYTTGYPPCCPWRRGNVRLSPASQSWSVLLSFAIFQTAIPIRPKHINRRTDRQTYRQTDANILILQLCSTCSELILKAYGSSLLHTRQKHSDQLRLQNLQHVTVSKHTRAHTDCYLGYTSMFETLLQIQLIVGHGRQRSDINKSNQRRKCLGLCDLVSI